jgi:hypothetical protein
MPGFPHHLEGLWPMPSHNVQAGIEYNGNMPPSVGSSLERHESSSLTCFFFEGLPTGISRFYE